MENNELTLKEFIALAVKVLEKAPYLKQREIIKVFFEKNCQNYCSLRRVFLHAAGYDKPHESP